MIRQVYKTAEGFMDTGSVLGCIMYWDKFGTYIGQEQMNCMDDDPEAPAAPFFHARGNEESVMYALTPEEMANAK